MRKSMSKRLIATVVLTTMIAGNSTVAVYANEVKKDESVYVTLSSDGTENEKIVSDWIHSNDSNATITDKSSLEEIKNVKGEEKPEQNGENLTWTLKDNDLYYQGKSTKQLPISVSIKYYLDGAEVSKEDIAGKSGRVKITLKFTNNSYEEKKIGDKMRKIYTPISVAGGMTLPTDTFKNIKINQGKIISEGSTNIASFAALPGMKETLDIDSEASSKINVDLNDTIEVEADATNFSLGPIMMAATTMIPELQTVDAADDIDKLNDSLKELKDASDKLLDGTNKLKDGTDEATSKLSEAKSKLSDPKMQQKLSLITNDNNVSRARRLIEDAFVAQGMDTSSVNELLGLMSAGNFEKADALLADVRDLSQYKSTLDSTVTAINGLTGDKKVQKLIADTVEAKNAYENINPETKQSIINLVNLLNEDGIKASQKKVSVLFANTQIAKGDADFLIQKILQIFNKSDPKVAISQITNFNTTIDNVETISKEMQESLKDTNIGADITKYGQAYLILQAYTLAGNDFNTIKTQAIAAINNSSYPAQYKQILVGTISGLTEEQWKSGNMLNDLNNMGKYQKAFGYINNLQNELGSLEKIKPVLQSSLNLLQNQDVQKATGTLINYYNALNSEDMKKEIDKITKIEQIYVNLSDSDIKNIIQAKNLALTLASDVEANKQNIESIEKMAAGLKGKDKEITAKVDKLEKDMAKAKPLLNSVEALAGKADKNSIDKATSMAKTLLSMQSDLKNSDDILRITQDALSKNNISQARNLMNSLPTLEDGIKQLSDGISQLNDGMKKFSDEGINKINDKGTTAVTDVKDLLKVKDEMVDMSKKFDNFAGKDDSMTSEVKFIMKTEEIKAPAAKVEKTKTTTEKKTGIIEWFKNLFK